MASGTISLGTNGKLTGQLVWSSTSNGATENSSTVTINIQAKKTSSSEATTGTWTGTAQIGENIEKYSKYASIGASWVTLKTYTKTIKHQDSGYQDVYLFGSITGPTGTTLSGKTVGQGSSVVLDKIARASQPSLVTWPDTTTNVTIGETILIHMNSKSSSFTHTVRYSWYNKSGTIATGIGDNCKWTIPTSFCNDIPNTTFGTGVVYVDTYSNGSLVGTKQVSFTGRINTDVIRPSFPTFTVTEASDVVPSSWGVFVKNKSKLKFDISVTPSTGSSIVSITTQIDGGTYSGSSITTETIKTAGSVSLTVSATDSRGVTSSSSRAITIVDYGNPYITSASAIRCDVGGNYNDTGTYLRVDLKGGVYSIDGHNIASYKVQYKKTTEDSWMEYVFSSTDITFDGYIRLPNIDTNSSYDVQVVVSDYFTSTIKTLPPISTAFTTVDYLNGGHGIAFGKVAEEEDLMDINFNVKFHKGVECGVTLYDNSSGFSGTVTLNETSANFSYIEIFYKTTDNVYNSVKVYNPNNKFVNLYGSYPEKNNNRYDKNTISWISGTTIAPSLWQQMYVNSDGGVTLYDTNLILVTRVIGYR